MLRFLFYFRNLVFVFFVFSRHLEERESLTNKVDAYARKLEEKEEEIKLLTRRNNLEAKNFKTQLANEKKKFKDLCQKFNTTEKPCGKNSSHGPDQNSAKDFRSVCII